MFGYFALWAVALAEALRRDDQNDFGSETHRNNYFDNRSIFDDDDVYESPRFEKEESWDDEYDEDECDDLEDLDDY